MPRARMGVDVYDPQGRSMPQGKGELVCTKAFPSMPVGFWNDPDGARMRAPTLTFSERLVPRRFL